LGINSTDKEEGGQEGRQKPFHNSFIKVAGNRKKNRVPFTGRVQVMGGGYFTDEGLSVQPMDCIGVSCTAIYGKN
jgi:hypothetical protein